MREAVEHRHAHLHLPDLTLKRARHHPLTQQLEPVHLRLHQAPAVIPTGLLPARPPEFARLLHDLVAPLEPGCLLLAQLGTLARRDDRLEAALGQRVMTRPGVINPIQGGTGPTSCSGAICSSSTGMAV